MTTIQELSQTHDKHTWCPGCGDIVILSSLKFALEELGYDQKDVVITTGIGCGSKINHYVNVYGFEGLHGRPLAYATGVKLANNRLKVIAIGGDGDGYGIGGNHFIHTMRRNLDITYFVQNNNIYALTKGQTSPTCAQGFKSVTTPHGVLELPINPIALALATDATFIARGFALELKELRKLMTTAIKHKGIALVDILQPCVTWRKDHTMDFYKNHTYKLDEQNHNPRDKNAAWQKALEYGDKIPLGIFYIEDRPTYEDGLPQMSKVPLVDHDISHIDVQRLWDERK